MIRGYSTSPAPARRKRCLWPLALLPMAALLFLPRPASQDALYPITAMQVAAQPAYTLPESILPGLPEGPRRSLTVPNRHLEQGRMLLIDEAHPLPDGYAPHDALSVAATTHGQVICRDQGVVAGQDTLAALTDLFAEARRQRIIQLTVFAGTRSREQQRILQTDALDAFSRDMPLDAALIAARRAVASPDCSEHQTPWAVDIRICPTWNGAPLDGPLKDSPAGQWLMENCWAYGFILRWPEEMPAAHSCRAYHLRYVGRAHAALMHALGATLEEYQALLRQHGALTLVDPEKKPLAAAICQQAGEHQTSFVLPDGTVEDLSLDNTGYAIAGCLFTE